MHLRTQHQARANPTAAEILVHGRARHPFLRAVVRQETIKRPGRGAPPPPHDQRDAEAPPEGIVVVVARLHAAPLAYESKRAFGLFCAAVSSALTPPARAPTRIFSLAEMTMMSF